MPQLTVQVRDIRGLTPAIDPVNSGDTFILDGKNFLFDSKGPKTPFGSAFLNGVPFRGEFMRRGWQVIREADRIFVCTNEAIYLWDTFTNQLQPLFVFEPFQLVGRWSHGFLDGAVFFCHPGFGILYWDLRNGLKGLHNVPGLPSAPLAIVVDNGRLVVMDNRTITWSAPSDPFNFRPALGGAGAQAISERVGGDPVFITSYSRGTLTWTTQGVMRSEFNGGVESYRHRGINTEYRPVNSFCIVKFDDSTSIVLDPRGLFSTAGEPPVAFTPTFNEYLIQELPLNDSLERNNLRLELDPLTRQLFISRAFTVHGDLYDEAFVLYVPLEKWGFFNKKHYGFGRGLWLDENGFVRQFANTPFSLTQPQDTQSYFFDLRRDYPEYSQRQRQITTVGSTIRFAALPESTQDQMRVPGQYLFDGSALQTFGREALGAEIYIGFFRLQTEEAADSLIRIKNVVIGSVVSRELSAPDEDYNIVPDGVNDADYNALLGGEDFGIDPKSFVNFGIESIGSNDGFSVFTQTVPQLARFNEAQRIFAGGANGIWHSIKLTTNNVGEYFHVQSFQLNGSPSGRLL